MRGVDTHSGVVPATQGLDVRILGQAPRRVAHVDWRRGVEDDPHGVASAEHRGADGGGPSETELRLRADNP